MCAPVALSLGGGNIPRDVGARKGPREFDHIGIGRRRFCRGEARVSGHRCHRP